MQISNCKKIFYTAIIAAMGINAHASAPRLAYTSQISDYVAPASSPAAPARMVYMPDGLSYLTLSADRTKILRFDTKTGKEIETFMELAKARETVLPDIEGFSLSPNASKILLYRNRTAIYRRSFTAEYYTYEVRTRLLRPISVAHKRQQIPVFSADSRMVAFVADNNIYIRKLDYNTEVAVTDDGEAGKIINGASDWTYEEEFTTTRSMAFSPDNSTLCFVKYNESAVPTYTLPIYSSSCSPDARYALYPGQFSYKYPVAGQTNSTVTLHSYDVETRKVKDIPFPDANIEYIPNIAFAPQGNTLIVPTLNREQNRLEIYNVSPKSTVVKSIYVETSNTWITPETYERIHYADDCFTLLSSKSGFAHLYQHSYNGSELRQLTTGDFDVTAYYGTDAAGNRYYQSATPTPLDRTVHFTDRKGMDHVLGDATGWNAATFVPGMTLAVLSHSDAKTAPRYTLATPTGKTIRTLEDNAAYMAKLPADLPMREFTTVNSDGVALNAYIIKPTGFNASKKYPAIMVQYSGPGSQSVTNSWKMDFEQFYATQGYVIFCVDGRGTGARGRKFCDIVYRNLGHYETIDQVNAAAHLASLPYVDGKRIGIYGWSYGGYEALMCATAQQSPFAAAVAIAAVTDWRFYDTVYAERYMSTPQQNDEGYLQSAPLNRAAKLACPLLLMYGTADDNVHPANSLEFVSSLQNHGMLCDMFVFPNMNHSINGCNSRKVVYAKMLDFFDNNLR